MKNKRPPSEQIKELKFLYGMDIEEKVKRQLRNQARKWIKYIKLHSKEMDHPFDNMYHRGEISFIELFFLSKPKINIKK
jgi:hypothetical protein